MWRQWEWASTFVFVGVGGVGGGGGSEVSASIDLGGAKKCVHRPGIEPGPPAWQASILPLNQRCYLKLWVNVEEGLEPACERGEKKISQSVGFEPTLPEGN